MAKLVVRKPLTILGGQYMVGFTPATLLTDEFFNQVTLLLQGDQVDQAQNNTFLDSSSNSFTITRNGNTTQGSYSPYGDRWSNFFDGVDSYLQIANDASLQMGTGDFTIECWWYPKDLSAGYITVFEKGYNLSGALDLQTGNGNGKLIVYTDGTATITSNTALNTYEWTHIAVVRNSGTLTLYQNGVSVASASDSVNLTESNPLGIGGDTGTGASSPGGHPNFGYISDFRVVKGTAVYTSEFTPPTEPLTAISGTSLLTCQGNRFKDVSSNNHTITPNNGPLVIPNSPYGLADVYATAQYGGSGYFDGNGDYLSYPTTTTASKFEGADFTLEFWIYIADLSYDHTIFSARNGANRTGPVFRIGSTGHVYALIPSSGTVWGVDTRFTAGNSISANQWSHVAITREGTNLRVFIDGVLSYTVTINFSIYWPSLVARIGDDAGGGDAMSGYISDLRMVKGTALYTSNFTPPTTPLTAITNTSLLCNFTNAGIFDSSRRAVLESFSGVQIDTTIKKYGSGSIQFNIPSDGVDDFLTSRNQKLVDFGTGDFTIEMWVYWTRTTGTEILIDTRSVGGAPPTGSAGALAVYFVNDKLAYWDNGANRIQDTVNFPQNQWVHVAVSRDSNGVKLFKNGTQVGSTYATIIDMTEDVLTIGKVVGMGNEFGGYMDDIRITKGVARYTADFTPPTTALPAIYGAVSESSGETVASALGDRGIFAGGRASSNTNIIDYVTISTPGNATDFGDLPYSDRFGAGCSDGSRGIYAGGDGGKLAIYYITISTLGNAAFFGALTVGRRGPAAASNTTYGLIAGGATGGTSLVGPSIDYITIATTGNATDFGDLTVSRFVFGGTSDMTYGVFAGGSDTVNRLNVIDYVTIDTPGNATDFGDLIVTLGGSAGVSDLTYGVFAGSDGTNTSIEYITIATPGNATDFGDLTYNPLGGQAGSSNGPRGVFGGGYGSPNYADINYITIATPGNAIDFGDLTSGRHYLAGMSGD